MMTRPLALFLLGTALAGCSGVESGSSAGKAGSELQPDDLFGPAPSCQTAPQELPSHRAEVAEEAAHAKMQRYPFEPSDGVEAVALLSEAADCRKRAGGNASPLWRRASGYRRRIWEDFAAHRLRLELATRNQQLADALAEVRAVRALWPRDSDDYAAALRREESELKQRIAAEKEK